MIYEEAIQKINSLLRFGMKPGLERVEKLLCLLESPQKKLKFIHVAGTNGKGSTCVLISSVLTHAGYRTGLFISPYVSDFCERFQIDGDMISHEELISLVEEVFPVVQKMAQNDEIITEFEMITAIAMLWFSRRGCDAVVLEVGLGGRLDSTNVIPTPLVSVICPISLDHTAILGDTVEQIAAEKCGIIKPYGTTVTSPCQYPGALAVIQSAAEERHNQFLKADLSAAEIINSSLDGTKLVWNNISLHLPFIGAHQVCNAITALTALSVLQKHMFTIPNEAFISGFSAARFPARLEILSREPLVLLDGAHNPDGTAVLADALKTHLGGRRIVALMGMLADKDAQTAIQNLNGLFSHVVTLAPKNARAMSAQELAEIWKQEGTPATATKSAEEALRLLFRIADGDPAVICGSLYLAGDARSLALSML